MRRFWVYGHVHAAGADIRTTVYFINLPWSHVSYSWLDWDWAQRLVIPRRQFSAALHLPFNWQIGVRIGAHNKIAIGRTY